MKRIITITLALLIVASVSAQKTVKLNIDNLLKDKAFAYNQESQNNLNNAFKLTRLEYYISKISITHDGGQTTEAKDVYILVNASNNVAADLGSYNITTIENIKFYIGVNAPQNNQDPTQWPGGHPLAPRSPSMHWGWTAGYRFVAMEGKGGSSLNTTFELHALGNKYYYPIQIPVTGKDVGGELHIDLKADYTKSIENIDVSGGILIHGEDGPTIKLLQNFRDYVFTSGTGATNVLASVNTPVSPNALSIYPNPTTTGTINIDIIDNSIDYTGVTVSDITGKEIISTNINSNSTNQIQLLEKGIYLISLMNNERRLVTKKLIVQ